MNELMPITWSDLLGALPANSLLDAQGDPQTPIRAPIVEDHNELEAGGVFVARKGRSVDGHDFIAQALARGAVAIVGEAPLSHLGVPYAQVHDGQAAIGWLAAAYQGFPTRDLVVIGVTGTDGKTTTTHLIHSVLKSAGLNAAFISTIAADLGTTTADTGLHVTTPSAPHVQQYLRQMRDNGMTHVVLEMTSHGLAQGRLNGVDVDVAVLTNITHEHLDYHGSWENYRAAKGILFQSLGRTARKSGQRKLSVINADDPSFDYFAQFDADVVIAYAMHHAADFVTEDVQFLPQGLQFTVQQQTITSPLVGRFNVSNILAAIAVGRALGVSWEAIRDGVANVEAISGRMQRIDEGQNFTAIVDFAHTPNALRRALEAGRTMLPDGKRLIAVFGSAGLRDVEKRRMMAEVSAEYADFTILTAEDPRTESLDAILEMMAEGCRSKGAIEGETFIRVPDRGEAIYRACQLARAGDIVMICGKGHEQSMCFGTIEYPWDDREATRAALRGAPLKTLPTAS